MTNEFGASHSDKKVEKLAAYMQLFTTALKEQKFGLIFIDAFAGSGDRTTIRDADPDFFGTEKDVITTPGSARRALETKPPFNANVFIEMSPTRYKILESVVKEYPDAKVKLLKGDANQYVSKLCKGIDRHKPKGPTLGMRGVIFLDPFGMEVDWETLRAVANTKALDAWIFFPLMGLYRNSPRERVDLTPTKRKAITKVLGTPDWEDDWYNKEPPIQDDLFGDQKPEGETRSLDVNGIEKYVQKRLRTIFKGAVLDPLRINNDRGAPLASLFFCVSNEAPKAVGLARKLANHILKSGM